VARNSILIHARDGSDTGRVGRRRSRKATWLRSGAAQSALTSLVSLGSNLCYFDVDEQTYLKYARVTQSHGTSSHDLRGAALLGLADETFLLTLVR